MSQGFSEVKFDTNNNAGLESTSSADLSLHKRATKTNDDNTDNNDVTGNRSQEQQSSSSSLYELICSPFIMISVAVIGLFMVNDMAYNRLRSESTDWIDIMTTLFTIFMSIYGLWSLGTKFLNRQISWPYHLVLGLCSLLSTVSKNNADTYAIDMTLKYVFKQGGLPITLVIAYLFFQKRYHLRQILGVIIIAIGVFFCTMGSINATSSTQAENSDTLSMCKGIAHLLFSLVCASLLGLFQEISFEKFGDHIMEVLFYTNLFQLPFFLGWYWHKLFMIPHLISNSPEITVIPVVGVNVTMCGFLLFVCVFAQIFGKIAITKLNNESNTLTTEVVSTVRKFLSIIVSIFWLGNPFTFCTGLGIVFLFVGCVMFSGQMNIFNEPKEQQD